MNKETEHNYLEDLQEIKSIMNRSSRFISLSGLSGVMAGAFALIGAFLAYQIVYEDKAFSYLRRVEMSSEHIWQLLSIAVIVLVLSLASGVFFTVRKAKKEKQKVWDLQSKRLLVNLFIPLAAGGLLSLIFLIKGYVGMVAPLTLIFYGLALVNASKYTFPVVRSLGLLEIALGLVAAYFVGYGLLFWAIGFGVLHIIYGVYMHKKHGD